MDNSSPVLCHNSLRNREQNVESHLRLPRLLPNQTLQENRAGHIAASDWSSQNCKCRLLQNHLPLKHPLRIGTRVWPLPVKPPLSKQHLENLADSLCRYWITRTFHYLRSENRQTYRSQVLLNLTLAFSLRIWKWLFHHDSLLHN